MTKSRKIWIAATSAVVIVAVVVFGALVNPLGVYVALHGENEVTVSFGDTFTDPGASARLGAKAFPTHVANLEVATAGKVNTSEVGDYQVSYDAHWWFLSDHAVRTVHVVDVKAPELVLEGEQKMSIDAGSEFKDPGVRATDDVDGDVTTKVAVSGKVDTAVPGDYTLTYEVADAAGHKTSATRVVTVRPAAHKTPANPGHKVVYLTFDDGPSVYTASLLDVLKARGVKATFFVTGHGDSSLIARAAAEGHAVGVHTMTHNYNQIYASKKAYLDDLAQISNLVTAQTGKATHLLRFPGGSSNTVSRITPGIMTELSKDLPARGYYYFDWNVSSGDAGAPTTSDAVFKNIVSGIQAHDVSVVLQHDTKEFSVQAVDRVLQWGQEHGYTFLPLDETSPGMHHRIVN
ncbi:polysaccharide deacetylase family protein [Trueperella pecoris]|uniref:Polysaccharide deacetylase family protein n=1 Tax=Trueperella pecoris TaxID=2733571 RepID=A0A7M1QXP2_9ACTO|nr:polysaccharide deacetylase family protein [Trueperella pecoris]QOR46872.1 polysaccharide deacetylase family protein [Trueperella pecoris]